jgi:hypothetical protein
MSRRAMDRQRRRDGSTLRDLVSGRSRRRQRQTVDGMSPRSSYEAVTRQMVKSLTHEVRDIKQRVNQLITLIVGAILLEVFMRLIVT